MPRSSEIRPIATNLNTSQPEYSQEERALLLRLAHEAILSSLERRDLLNVPTSQHLSESRGAFTTLYLHGKLRGCVGYPMPVMPVSRTVIETARAAAFEDPRFAPITLDEARALQISLSVLSPMQPIAPEQVQVGLHGLLMSHAGHRGLLLPQVATEHGWDRITFLEQTCLKAGLAADSWRAARVEAFTAEVFGDAE